MRTIKRYKEIKHWSWFTVAFGLFAWSFVGVLLGKFILDSSMINGALAVAMTIAYSLVIGYPFYESVKWLETYGTAPDWVLEEMEKGPPSTSEVLEDLREVEGIEFRCPKCGSENVGISSWGEWWCDDCDASGKFKDAEDSP